MIAIPNPLDAPFVSLRTTLDGAEYVLRLEYNLRSGWFVGVTAPDGTVLTSPRKAHPFVDLLSGVTSTKQPPGILSLTPIDPADTSEPSLADLGRTHYLVYVTAEEVAGG